MRQGEGHGYDLEGDKGRGMVMILKETRGETRSQKP